MELRPAPITVQPAAPVRLGSVAEPAEAPVPFVPRRLRAGSTLFALAMVSGVVALGAGTAAVVLELRSSPATDASEERRVDNALRMLAQPATQRTELTGDLGRLTFAVGPGGYAVLVNTGLDREPTGQVYRAWLTFPGGGGPQPVATFRASDSYVPLAVRVRRGATVGVSVESDAAAGPGPRSSYVFVARRP